MNSKAKVQQNIDKRRREIIDLGERIYRNPETGFREFKTSKLVSEKFRELGLDCTEFGDIPGVKVTIDTGKDGSGIAILGELDAVICTEHPHCIGETGAVHACGHNIQVAAMVGAAMGILDSDIAGELTGKIHFIAVPAEELIEVAFRKELREKGVIKYLCGKPELLYRGFFDDVDICVMIHALSGKKFSTGTTTNGNIVKKIRYIGKSSHAGGAPHDGINALYAANLGLMAINSIRETFREEEYIRVHPIITKGGDTVNVIPCDVHIETYIRGKTMDDILKANKKVDRALVGGAIAVGAKVEIEDIPGIFPLISDRNLTSIARNVMAELVKVDEIAELGHVTFSTDLGDMSSLMPVIHPYIGGVEGGLHSVEFRIIDPDASYILGAKFLACTIIDLLWSKADAAKSIINKFNPVFSSKEEYFEYIDKLFCVKMLPESDYPD